MQFLADADLSLPRALRDIHRLAVEQPIESQVADYIPVLATAEAIRCGIAFATLDGEVHTAGDAELPFSIQSISKVFGLVLAMQRMGQRVREYIRAYAAGANGANVDSRRAVFKSRRGVVMASLVSSPDKN